jgi:2-C-methyl-D-erythritol 4-phosphate cytidylyltransferase
MDALVLTAAGSSTRFGGDVPKVFLPLAGVPVLVRAATPFLAVLPDAALVVTVRPGDEPRARALLPHATVVAGGATRQQSVLAGVRALPPGVEHVFVHDAARPLITVAVVRRVLAAVKAHGAAVAGLPVTDSVHALASPPDGRLSAPLDRAGLFAAQTPQAARRDWLLAALEAAEREGRQGTDEAALLLAAGYAVHAVEGDPQNLKLTRPGDLLLAEGLLRADDPAG